MPIKFAAGPLPPTDPGPAGYTVVDIARLHQCSVRHVRRLDAARAVPGRYTIGRLVRFHRSCVDQWIADGCPLPATRPTGRRPVQKTVHPTPM